MAEDTPTTEEQAPAPASEPALPEPRAVHDEAGLTAELDDDGPPDLEHRVLCPDGSCIGVIGRDGRCKECGARADGLPAAAAPEPLPAPPAAEPPATTPPPAEQIAAAAMVAEGSPPAPAASAAPPPEPDPAASGPDWTSRVLCSDGNCIGVIGPDRRCKECGKPYAGEPRD